MGLFPAPGQRPARGRQEDESIRLWKRGFSRSASQRGFLAAQTGQDKPEARGLGLFPGVSWTTLLSYAAYTGGVTILGIGLAPWALQLHGNWPSLLALYLGTLAIGAPVALVLTRGPGTEAVTAWAVAGVALAGVGLVLGHLGYRSWCDLELGRTDLGRR